MFSPPPETPVKSTNKQKCTRRKRKKQKQRNKQNTHQIKQSLSSTMSAWAENFTMAATWQLKHQVAMWKSKATALEYENQVLRETLRQIYVNGQTDTIPSNPSWNSENEQSYSVNKPSTSKYGQVEEQDQVDSEGDSVDQSDESELELEITEEYMAYLKQNYEFRKARDERKKKEAEEERRKHVEDIADPKPQSDGIEEYKKLYGEDWQRIVALDCYLSSEFMSLCDSTKPEYWPNIPLRL